MLKGPLIVISIFASIYFTGKYSFKLILRLPKFTRIVFIGILILILLFLMVDNSINYFISRDIQGLERIGLVFLFVISFFAMGFIFYFTVKFIGRIILKLPALGRNIFIAIVILAKNIHIGAEHMKYKEMILGIVIGLIIGFILFAYTPLGNRYFISTSPRGFAYKIDRWTGQTWFCARDSCSKSVIKEN